ncbi:hypothetical protein OG497_37910 [Streptomyces sp. NBC_01242]|uniref:hypothetical protein n=1 Tax=Streptomyces sp. NBC_01242 TaxID=2903795 RepID=UPI00224DE8F2|nr:hypothetical protein [Streptomyces sp. NBC_01242]MCX4799635.1 hypothetical protein [Streptomyces sp. NBC_01242]
MSTFDYLTPAEAVNAARSDAPDYQRITGLKGVDADRIPNLIPEEPWRAHGHLDKFKEIARVEWAKDADSGTAEVFYADDSTDLLHSGDLLCVERPITTPDADAAAVKYDVPDVEPDPETGLSTWSYYANGKIIGRIEETERGYVPVRTDSLGVETWRRTEKPFREQALTVIREHFEQMNGRTPNA